MHNHAKNYCTSVRNKFPGRFAKKDVLDIGSLDINGTNRHLFIKCNYLGVDIISGKNVDIVCPCHKLEYQNNLFDVIISTEMLEHDPHWKKSLQKMMDMLDYNGLLLLTFATHPRPEHCIPNDGEKDWIGYYKNLDTKDLIEALDPHTNFKRFQIEKLGCDLYFYGIKNAEPAKKEINIGTNPIVITNL